jgi:hypothetical protein
MCIEQSAMTKEFFTWCATHHEVPRFVSKNDGRLQNLELAAMADIHLVVAAVPS